MNERHTETFLIKKKKKSTATYQDDEGEMRVNVSAKQQSQIHNQGNAPLLIEKESKPPRLAQPITWPES